MAAVRANYDVALRLRDEGAGVQCQDRGQQAIDRSTADNHKNTLEQRVDASAGQQSSRVDLRHLDICPK